MMVNHLLIYYLKIASYSSAASEQEGAYNPARIDRNIVPKSDYHARFPGSLKLPFPRSSFFFSRKCRLSYWPLVECSLIRQLFWR